jgi:hypothetical protein
MSKKRRVTFVVCAVIVFAIVLWARMPAHPPELKVTISLDKSEFYPEQPIVLHATVTNEGEEPVEILEPSLEDLTFEVALYDHKGMRCEYLGPGSLKEMSEVARRNLEPGETVNLEVPLHEYFEPLLYSYTVVAAYRTLNYPDFKPYCRIASNELSFMRTTFSHIPGGAVVPFDAVEDSNEHPER